MASGITHLLFRQVCILAFIAGVLAIFLPWQGVAFLACLIFFIAREYRFTLRFLFLLAAFVIGSIYAGWQIAEEPEVPQIVEQARSANSKIFVMGEVQTSQRLSFNRTSLILNNITFIAPDKMLAAQTSTDKENSFNQQTQHLKDLAAQNGINYSGKLRLIWYSPKILARQGDIILAETAIKPMRGLDNPGTLDTETFWKNQGVFLSATAKSADVTVILQRTGSSIYQHLYLSFLKSLPQKSKTSALPGADVPPYSNSDTEPTNNIDLLNDIKPTVGAGFLPALIFGDRSYISPEHMELLGKSTLAHSIALSGLHLGYTVLLGFGVAWVFGRAYPNMWLFMPRQHFGLLVALPLAILYIWLGQSPISLLRASFMLFFWVLLFFMQKPKVVLDGLLWAVFVLLLLEPSSIMDLRLQLSAISVASIALSLPYMHRLTPPFLIQDDLSKKPAKRSLSELLRSVAVRCWQIFIVSSVVSIFLAPLVVFAFGKIAMLVPLNILWLPVLALWVMPLSFLGLAFSALGLTGMAETLLALASLAPEYLIVFLSWLDNSGFLIAPSLYRPHWIFGLGFWFLCLYLPLVLWPAKPKKRPQHAALAAFGATLCLTSIIWFIFVGTPKGVSLRVLDVGQGQSALVEWNLPTGKGRALIDGGSLSRTGFSMGKGVIAPTLTLQNFADIDYVLYSHPDNDHLGGLLYILENFDVHYYAGNGIEASTTLHQAERKILQQNNIYKQNLRKGDRVNLAEDLHLEVMWPEEDTKTPKNANETSLVLRLVWQGQGLSLLPGDLGSKSLETLSHLHKGKLASQILVLPHHGSKKSLSKDFYMEVNPIFAIASAGFANQWNFPSKEVCAALQALHIPLFSTNIHGQVKVLWQNPENMPEITFTRND